jgi:cytosine/uracil/thiamine/allantoin permease
MAEQSTLTNYSERLYNEDLAPAKERKWGAYSIFALWMSDVHNLGNYTFAAGLFVIGLSAWEVLVSMALGFTIIFIGMNCMGYAGQRTGIPIPVLVVAHLMLFSSRAGYSSARTVPDESHASPRSLKTTAPFSQGVPTVGAKCRSSAVHTMVV